MSNFTPLIRLVPLAALVGLIAIPSAARNRADTRLAGEHLTAITLLQRWSQALYRFGTPGEGHCTPRTGAWVDNGDGTYTREAVAADCTRVVLTNYGGFPSDYDQEVYYAGGLREKLSSRTVSRFNEGPGTVRFRHQFSTGDVVEYDQELRQEAALDGNGEPRPRINFWYALISRGTVTMVNGDCLHFALRQTKSPSCFNFLNRAYLPAAVCEEWYDVTDGDPASARPKPDRLEVTFDCGRLRGSMSLQIPMSDPGGSVPDFLKTATGQLALGPKTMQVTLRTDQPELRRWKYWETRGSGFTGAFLLGPDFSGSGQAFASKRPPRGRPQGQVRRGKLRFAMQWDPRGVGTVILPDGSTRAAGPFAGALEFGQLKWSGLATAFGPTPGL